MAKQIEMNFYSSDIPVAPLQDLLAASNTSDVESESKVREEKTEITSVYTNVKRFISDYVSDKK